MAGFELNQERLETMEARRQEEARHADEYARGQKAAGDTWNENKETAAKAYTEQLERQNSPAATSFREQNAIYGGLSTELRQNPQILAQREQVDQMLQQQDQGWRDLTKRMDANRAELRDLHTERFELQDRAHMEFDNMPAAHFQGRADALKPQADQARERLRDAATEKMQDNWALGSTHAAGASYQDQAQSALRRDQQFQRRMEQLQNGIERERDPLKKENLEAKRDVEFHSYKEQQTSKIASMTGSKDAAERSSEHGKSADAAAIRVHKTEAALAERRGEKVDKSVGNDLATVKEHKQLQKMADKKSSIESRQDAIQEKLTDNGLQRQSLLSEAQERAQARLGGIGRLQDQARERVTQQEQQKQLGMDPAKERSR